MWIPFSTAIALSLTCISIVISPGPDTLLILKNTASDGIKAGTRTVMGIQTGLLFHLLLALIGVSALVSSSPTAMRIVAICGALWLGYLGIKMITTNHNISINQPNITLKKQSAFTQALITNITNPKVIILFVVLFSGFLNMDQPIAPQLLQFTAILLVINFIWQMLLVLFTGQISTWLNNPFVQKWLDIICGIIFILIALYLVIEFWNMPNGT
ncbi:MAG: LysE family translocator [Alphaproteobacteria bacterium]